MPVQQREVRRISRDEAVSLLGECTNMRDYFLLYLLFETGMRIGEALSLWLEDFDLDALKIVVTDREELPNLAEIKTVHSSRKLDCTQELMDLFAEYICEIHTCEVYANHVFLKLRGVNAGKPMDYTDVDNLFRTLRRKTGIGITSHVFRHTSIFSILTKGSAWGCPTASRSLSRPYHFKTHSLRHTRACEYAEQGMPIGVIQRMLGHCSLQMTLHYARVSENVLYERWKETEALGILHLGSTPPGRSDAQGAPEDVCYERIRKGLDAVRVPLGICFKPSKLSCRTQLKHCLECASFCSSRGNEAEYQEEIKRVGAQMALGKRLGRQEWIRKTRNTWGCFLRCRNGSKRKEPFIRTALFGRLPMPNQEGLYKNNTERTRTAREKALEAIPALKSERKPVNFSTIAKQSGVSRHFLYSDGEVKMAIEEQ